MALRYAHVGDRCERIAIVGSGASLRRVDLRFPRSVTVIAVNGAITYLPRADYWFTLDPSPENYALMASPRKGVIYYCAVPEDYGTPNAFAPEMRVPLLEHVRYLRRIVGDGWGRYAIKLGLCRETDAIHSGNSAWGAMQLANHMRPCRVGLFGVDGAGPRRDGSRPKELGMMPELFASADMTAEVVNGSPNSTVTCFVRTSPEEAKRWLAE